MPIMIVETLDPLLAGAAGLAVFAVLLAWVGWSGVRRLRRQLATVTERMGQLEQATQSTATLFAANDQHMEGMADQLRQLNKRQELLDASSSRSGFNQAIALTRHGASLDELVDTCGVSRGEARLIQTLHGAGAAGHAPGEQVGSGTASRLQP